MSWAEGGDDPRGKEVGHIEECHPRRGHRRPPVLCRDLGGVYSAWAAHCGRCPGRWSRAQRTGSRSKYKWRRSSSGRRPILIKTAGPIWKTATGSMPFMCITANPPARETPGARQCAGRAGPRPVLRAASVVQSTVMNPRGQRLGEIKDVVDDSVAGQVAYVVLAFGTYPCGGTSGSRCRGKPSSSPRA